MREKDNALTEYGPRMEAAVLMHNIQRVIQESERLKKEVCSRLHLLALPAPSHHTPINCDAGV